jgi:transposase
VVSSHRAGTSLMIERQQPGASDLVARGTHSRSSRPACSTTMEETMRYLGLDVHTKSTVWSLHDNTGEIEHGKLETTGPELQKLVKRLSATEELVVGQEVGTMSHFVHDALSAVAIRNLAFNAAQMRMIASSRKKTDRRDAWWIAKALAAGITPHPVYIPDTQVRLVRSLLSRRNAIANERRRWQMRARSYLRAAGFRLPKARRSVDWLLQWAETQELGIDAHLADALQLCGRQHKELGLELKSIDKQLRRMTKDLPEIQRLQTIPAVGEKVAIAIYAWVGDVTRFRNARLLCSYAGLVPSVHQSGETERMGGITKQGSTPLRSILVQAGHVLLFRCTSESAAPLRAIANRIHKNRARRKIAIVAAARHILRLAFYVLRDGTDYNPALLRSATEVTQAA